MQCLKVNDYIEKIKESFHGSDEEILSFFKGLREAHYKGKMLWALGNGGSLAVAQHFAQDMIKAAGIRVQAVSCPSIITAFSNDDGFEYSYFNALSVLSSEMDPIIIFSCSGNSRNYIEFVSGFGNRKNPIYSIVGTNGGFLKEKSNKCIHIKSNNYQICESAFQITADIIVNLFQEDK